MEGNIILQTAPKPDVAGAAITGGSSVVTSILNGISASHAAKKNYQYSRQLMLEQNRLNRENYEIQRRDRISDILNSASWERQARKNAGLSTADADGSSAAQTAAGSGASSEPQIDSASPGTSNMQPIDYSSILGTAAQVARSFIENENTQADTDKKRSEAAGVDIDNMTKYDRQIAELEKLRADGKISDNEAERSILKLKFERDTYNFEVEKEKNAAKISACDAKIREEQQKQEPLRTQLLDLSVKINEEQRKQAVFITETQVQRFNMEMQKFAAEIRELQSRAILNDANTGVALETKGLIAVQRFGEEIKNTLEGAKIPYAGLVASNLSSQLANAVRLQSYQLESEGYKAAMLKFDSEHQKQTYYFNMVNQGVNTLCNVTKTITSALNPVAGFVQGGGFTGPTPSPLPQGYTNIPFTPTYY